MPFTSFAVGKVRASALDAAFGWTPVTIKRTTDQSRTNNTALIDDDTLFFTPAINTSWAVQWVLLYSATAAQDGKIALTWPAGATVPWGYQGYDTALAFSSIGFDSTAVSGSSFPIGGNGAANTLKVVIDATVTMGGTAGSVKLQFAENAALAATSMTNRIGSRMTYAHIT